MAILAILYLRQRPGASVRAARDPGLRPTVDPSAVTHDAEESLRRLVAEADGLAARLERLLADAQAAIERLDRAAPAGDPPRRRASGLPPADAPLDAATLRIYELADAGRTPVEIARALGQHTGQVELILALRR